MPEHGGSLKLQAKKGKRTERTEKGIMGAHVHSPLMHTTVYSNKTDWEVNNTLSLMHYNTQCPQRLQKHTYWNTWP